MSAVSGGGAPSPPHLLQHSPTLKKLLLLPAHPPYSNLGQQEEGAAAPTSCIGLPGSRTESACGYKGPPPAGESTPAPPSAGAGRRGWVGAPAGRRGWVGAPAPSLQCCRQPHTGPVTGSCCCCPCSLPRGRAGSWRSCSRGLGFNQIYMSAQIAQSRDHGNRFQTNIDALCTLCLGLLTWVLLIL